MVDTSIPFATATAADFYWMAQALQLARKGRFTTHPNPRVGCVILDAQGRQVGAGFHAKAGEPHAEVYALRQAAARAQGGCVYVTLEPCSHYGKTPPCADALIAAQVARVVVAMTDPNPQVAGKGLAKLAAAGIEVVLNVLEQEARELNRGFIKRMLTGKPYVTVKIGCSLDGKIALRNGASQWITSAAARQDVQYYRAQASAIMTGAGTALADDPSLLVRLSPQQLQADYPSATLRQPTRIVVDSYGRLPSHLQLFTDGQSTLRARCDATTSPHDIAVPEKDGRLDMSALMRLLGQRQFNDILVEAGPRLTGALLMAGEVDELVLYQAPVLLGHSAQSLAELPDFSSLNDTLRWQRVSTEVIGPDIKMVMRPTR